MNKKTLVIAAVGLALIASATGCANKAPTTPPTTQKQQQGQMPPTQQAPASKPLDAEKVAADINKLLDEKYPGEWKVSGTTLSKGNYTENKNYGIADAVEKAYPGSMVSVFVGQDRVSSTVKNSQTNERVLTGYPTPPKVAETIQSGKPSAGSSSGMGGGASIGSYQKVYVPFKSGDKVVAVMSISMQ